MKSVCCLCIQFTHENTSERTILHLVKQKFPDRPLFQVWLLALQKRLATPLRCWWSRLQRRAELKISITFTELQVMFDFFLYLYYHFISRCNHIMLRYPLLLSSNLPFVYRFGLLIMWSIFYSIMHTHWKHGVISVHRPSH
jgi:hypothetical protein